MDSKGLEALRKAVASRKSKVVKEALEGNDRFKGFHPCHLIPAMSGSDWVFSSKSLRQSLISRISTKTTGKLKTVRKILKLSWPKFLEEEKEEEVGYTPFHIACMFGSSKAINGLLKAGANPKVHTPSGWDAVELSSYRTGMLDLQYDVTFNFFHAVHLDLLHKFTKGSVLDIKGMRAYLKERELGEWVELLDLQYGAAATEKKNDGAESEFKGIVAEMEKIIATHKEDQHKIDALPDVEEIYTLDEAFANPKTGEGDDALSAAADKTLSQPAPGTKSQLSQRRRSSITAIHKRLSVAKLASASNPSSNQPKVRPKGRSKQKVRLYGRDADSARMDWKNQETRFMAGELAKFVSRILGKEVNPNFVYSLRTGIELCDLVSKVSRGKVSPKGVYREISYTAMAKARYANNVYKFTSACQKCGIDSTDLCTYSNFQGDGDIQPILNNLYALLGIALRNGFDVPETLIEKVKEFKLRPMKKEEPPVKDDDGEEEEGGEQKVEDETPEIDDDKEITLTVTLPQGGWIELKVPKTETIARVKEMIEERVSVPTDMQVLKFAGRPLANDETLEDAGLSDGSEVALEVQSSKPSAWLSFLSPSALVMGALSASLLSLIAAVLALLLGSWAVASHGASTSFSYGLFGYSSSSSSSTHFIQYTSQVGWDEATTTLSVMGERVCTLMVLGCICSLVATCIHVQMLLFKNKETAAADGDSRKIDYSEGGKEEGGAAMAAMLSSGLDWATDRTFLVSVAGGCLYAMSVVVWSYVAAPQAYALTRYLVSETVVGYGYGASFLCAGIGSLASLASATFLFCLRFLETAQRLDENSEGRKNISTYGSIELVLEPTAFQQQRWCS